MSHFTSFHFITTILVFLIGHVTSSPCGPCTCVTDDASMTHVNCSERGLTDVPSNLPPSTRYLDLSNNTIAPENLHGICEYALMTLNLTGNQLNTLSQREFLKCYITEHVDFTGNIFDEVSNASFIGLQNLKKVSNLESRYYHPQALSTLGSLVELSIIIHQANITDDLFVNLDRLQVLTVDIRKARYIQENLFRPISSTVKKLTMMTKSMSIITNNILNDFSVLEEFTLHGRNLDSIPETLFQSTPVLTSVCMRGMGSLPRYIFSNLDNLATLQLHEVEDMPSDIFEGLLKLEHLNLAECSISSIPYEWFRDLWSVEVLDLREVGLRVVTADDFIGLKKLARIELSNNRLKSLDAFSFTKVKSTIEYIGLQENDLKVIDDDIFTHLTNLTELDLASNKIHSISRRAFYSLTSLQDLNLHDNKIYKLNEDVFSTNDELEVLDLSSNVISDTEVSVFDHLTSLRVLYLSDNRLDNFTYVIASLSPSVSLVDLSMNLLDCVCLSPSLLARLENVTLLGTCQNMTQDLSLHDYIHSEECWPETTTVTTTTSTNTTTMAYVYITKPPMKPTKSTSKLEKHETETPADVTTTTTTSLKPRKRVKLGRITTQPDFTRDVIETPRDDNTEGNGKTEAAFGFEDSEPTSSTYYIAVACISTVSVLSIAILVYLWYRKLRRQRGYEVSNIADQDLSNIVAGTDGQTNTQTNGPVPLTDVPSIQIDKVEDGNKGNTFNVE